MKFNVACIQLNSNNIMADNISKAEKFIISAAQKGADFIALPENAAFMPESEADIIKNKYYQNDHPALKVFRKIAENVKKWLLIGSIPVAIEGKEKMVNRSFLIDDKGNIASYYDKIHLFDVNIEGGESHVESKRYYYGNKVVVPQTPWGKLGMSICYDLRFPYLYRVMAKNGAEFITVPAAFTEFTGKAHWHILLRARAIENACYIIAPGQTGKHPANRETYGHSLIIDPWGEIIADAKKGEGVIMAQIDTQKVAKIRKSLPSLQHDRDYLL